MISHLKAREEARSLKVFMQRNRKSLTAMRREIRMPLDLRRKLRRFAKESNDPVDKKLVDDAIGFRCAVLREFNHLVRGRK